MPPESNQHGELFRSIGRTLAQRREAKGLTQDQVAEALHIGTEAVSRMERGITMPTVQLAAPGAENLPPRTVPEFFYREAVPPPEVLQPPPPPSFDPPPALPQQHPPA